MTLAFFLNWFQWVFLLYVVSSYFIYLILDFLAMYSISGFLHRPEVEHIIQPYNDYLYPISLIAPAYNEEKTISASIKSLLQLNYPEYEVVVVNDGSKDNTLEVLINNFKLVPVPDVYWQRIPAKSVKTIYRSLKYSNLRVVDKENGGKADALNVGINLSKYPLFCSIDADSLLHKDSLYLVVQPFIENEQTVASGGTVRALNGSKVENGYLHEKHLPMNFWALFQIVEYLRAFLFGRIGWSSVNGLLVISGAFGLFKKELVVDVGGYRCNTIGEDMELILRLHKHLRFNKIPYRISFIPEPVCWTEVPQDYKTLRNQRVRWQHGLSECLSLHYDLLFDRRGGIVSWLALPIQIVFEWLSCIIEFMGFIVLAIMVVLGFISLKAFLVFSFAAIMLGVFNSMTALLLEEMTFHSYPRLSHVFILIGISIVENFGYRQINSYWRLVGFFRWAFRRKAIWGEMKRTGI